MTILRKAKDVPLDEWAVGLDWVIDNVPPPPPVDPAVFGSDWAWSGPRYDPYESTRADPHWPYYFRWVKKPHYELAMKAWADRCRYALTDAGKLGFRPVAVFPADSVGALYYNLGLSGSKTLKGANNKYCTLYRSRRVFPPGWDHCPQEWDVGYVVGDVRTVTRATVVLLGGLAGFGTRFDYGPDDQPVQPTKPWRFYQTEEQARKASQALRAKRKYP